MFGNLKKQLIIFFILGCIYLLLEVLWRMGETAIETHSLRLVGESSFWMFMVGGMAAFIIGKMNENPITYKLPIWTQCLIGATVILVLEYISGYICNIVLGWGLWDYSGMWLNIQGQICLPFGILWFLLVPFAIWMDDFLSFKLFGDEKEYNISKVYKALFKGESFLNE